MKLWVAIIIYNRYDNLLHWLFCWAKCDHYNAQLVVIHNTDKVQKEYSDLCHKHNVKYISHANIGFDLGRFQDICFNRLKDFPEWDRLLWVADDTFPMSIDFVKQFNDKMEPGTGIVCMQVSPFVRQHIRTTGFMIDREVAEKLIFPHETITTKEHCYLFEHRDIKNTFYNQVTAMGLKVVQVAPNEISPLWDIGYGRKINRKKEHEDLFGKINLEDEKEDIVTFICPIYNSYPAIISSLVMQTFGKWKLMLIHDGASKDSFIKDYVARADDTRIEYIETNEHAGFWGHSIRSDYLQKTDTKYVVITNPDNYIVPTYIDKYLKGFAKNPEAVGVYCSQMVHSYKDWQVIPCSLRRGYLDCSGMMLKTKEAKKVGWKNKTDHSADWLFFSDLIKEYGATRFVIILGCLLIHN